MRPVTLPFSLSIEGCLGASVEARMALLLNQPRNELCLIALADVA